MFQSGFIESHDANVYNILISCLTVAFSIIELGDNIVPFSDDTQSSRDFLVIVHVCTLYAHEKS